jgi:hypothetical protein
MLIPFFLQRVSAFPRLALSEECDFKCWIKKLNITIDNISFSQSGAEVNIHNLHVFDIDVEEIKAEFYPNPQIVEDGIVIEAKVQADVTAEIAAKYGILSANGKFEADAKGVKITVGLKFVKGDNGLIESVVVIDNKCSASMDDLSLDFSGSFLVELIKIVKPILVNYLKNNIGTILCDNIKDALGNEMTSLFAQANEIIIPYLNKTDPIEIPMGENMVDLRTSVLIDVVRYLLTVFIGVNGPLNLNALINRFTNNTGKFQLSSVMNYFGAELPLQFSIPIDSLNATLNMSLNDVNLSHLNTWKDFTFLDPITPYILDTHTSLDKLGINVSFGINVSVQGQTITTGDSYLAEDGDLDLYMEDSHMDFQMQIASPKGQGLNYTTKQCLNLNCIEALFSPYGTGMTKLGLDTLMQDISIEASSQSMELEIRSFINNIVKLFVDNYSPIIPKLLNSLINTYGVKAVNDLLNTTLLNNDCQYIADDPYDEFNALTTFSALGASCILILIIYLFMILADSIREKKVTISSRSLYSLSINQDIVQANQDMSQVGCFASFFRTDGDASLLMNPKLPLFVRLLMPFLLFVNISMFFSSNSSIGASVFAKFSIGDDKLVSLPSMFDFGLINSIHDMYEAKAYFLAGLIAVMSCAWPYLKLVLMVITWILPSSILGKKKREGILKLLDALGKWSLVDSFVMILMLVAFHIAISFPTVSSQVKAPLTIFLYVYPAYGFVTLMIGTIVSLTLSHVILAIDRYVDESFESDNDAPEEKIALLNFCKTSWLKPFIAIILLATLGTLVSGLYFKSFSFDFVGLAGWAMTLLDQEHKNEYSVIDLGVKIPGAAEFPNSFGIRFTQVLYIIVSIVMPVLHTISLFILWVLPMTRKAQTFLYKACEIMYAWSCLDVFVISILAAVMEISQFARFMVGDKCDLIDPIVKMFFADEELITGHETCFDVITILLKGSWLLFAAAIFHDTATIIVNKVAGKALEERSLSVASTSKKSYLTTKAMISSASESIIFD